MSRVVRDILGRRTFIHSEIIRRKGRMNGEEDGMKKKKMFKDFLYRKNMMKARDRNYWM